MFEKEVNVREQSNELRSLWQNMHVSVGDLCRYCGCRLLGLGSIVGSNTVCRRHWTIYHLESSNGASSDQRSRKWDNTSVRKLRSNCIIIRVALLLCSLLSDSFDGFKVRLVLVRRQRIKQRVSLTNYIHTGEGSGLVRNSVNRSQGFSDWKWKLNKSQKLHPYSKACWRPWQANIQYMSIRFVIPSKL